jgi:hypothetical protein
MRPVREITADEENFRLEPIDGCSNAGCIRRDPVKPEPEGTIILKAFRITGYDQDCDGSLMARLEAIDQKGDTTGWQPKNIGLYPSTELVVSLEELQEMFNQK